MHMNQDGLSPFNFAAELAVGNIVRRVLHMIREESQNVRSIYCLASNLMVDDLHVKPMPQLSSQAGWSAGGEGGGCHSKGCSTVREGENYRPFEQSLPAAAAQECLATQPFGLAAR